jgi:hypothetical protein
MRFEYSIFSLVCSTHRSILYSFSPLLLETQSSWRCWLIESFRVAEDHTYLMKSPCRYSTAHKQSCEAARARVILPTLSPFAQAPSTHSQNSLSLLSRCDSIERREGASEMHSRSPPIVRGNGLNYHAGFHISVFA